MFVFFIIYFFHPPCLHEMWSCVLPYIRVSYRHLLVWNWVEIFTICVCVLWRQRLGVEMFQCLSFCFLHENSSVPKHGRKKSHVLIWKWVRVSLIHSFILHIPMPISRLILTWVIIGEHKRTSSHKGRWDNDTLLSIMYPEANKLPSWVMWKFRANI